MGLIDLTLTIGTREKAALPREEAVKQGDGAGYTAMIYDFEHDSMTGTYIDFPGHIKETDDGRHAGNYPITKLFRVNTNVIRLDKRDGAGGIGARELREACPCPIDGGGLIINALGDRRFDQIKFRSVYLEKDAVCWIVDSGIHLLVSDVYESPALHGVFGALFKAGISTVCCAVNLHQLTAPRVELSVMPGRYEGVTQLPCRVVAQTGELNSEKE